MFGEELTEIEQPLLLYTSKMPAEDGEVLPQKKKKVNAYIVLLILVSEIISNDP